MILICGQTLCGRVDQVPGTCYVATRFFHLYYVPLIPLSSWVIAQGSERTGRFTGQQIPLCGRSVLFGWAQAFLIVFGMVYLFWGGVLLANHDPALNNGFDGALKFVLGLTCLCAWLLFRIRPFQAGQERTDELLAYLGMELNTTNETLSEHAPARPQDELIASGNQYADRDSSRSP